ncbi:hypothetical protein BC937DRAFT_87876 [Endogone sp. FLAS-F59071]|nr:hypothetical protein BC937DRAFT_87876 [Endogone sp. FLAS-F59071]|eukprot:RUS22677.1 hypothetical protein BC937DRAFT_87876 [Endogone sp. FLAS-F59071]
MLVSMILYTRKNLALVLQSSYLLKNLAATVLGKAIEINSIGHLTSEIKLCIKLVLAESVLSIAGEYNRGLLSTIITSNYLASIKIVYMDEFINQLLHEERVCDIILPRITKGLALEDADELPLRKSALKDDLKDND